MKFQLSRATLVCFIACLSKPSNGSDHISIILISNYSGNYVSPAIPKESAMHFARTSLLIVSNALQNKIDDYLMMDEECYII